MPFDVLCTMLTHSSLYIGTTRIWFIIKTVPIERTGFKNTNQFEYPRTTGLEDNAVAVFHSTTHQLAMNYIWQVHYRLNYSPVFTNLFTCIFFKLVLFTCFYKQFYNRLKNPEKNGIRSALFFHIRFNKKYFRSVWLNNMQVPHLRKVTKIVSCTS